MVRDKVPTIVGLPLLSLLAVSLVTVSAVPVTTTTTLPLREESTLAEHDQSWVLGFAIRGQSVRLIAHLEPLLDRTQLSMQLLWSTQSS
jgi:hypothetical protein